jgi:hypothetical protein
MSPLGLGAVASHMQTPLVGRGLGWQRPVAIVVPFQETLGLGVSNDYRRHADTAHSRDVICMDASMDDVCIRLVRHLGHSPAPESCKEGGTSRVRRHLRTPRNKD